MLLVFGCSDPKVSKDNIEKEIINLEKKALDKWADGDPVGYAENFTDNATYFDDIGAQNRLEGKAELSAYFKSLEGNIPAHHYEIVNPRVQVLGDVAVLTLRYNASSPDNQPGPPWKSTSVYQLSDGQWKVVHANWSLIKQ